MARDKCKDLGQDLNMFLISPLDTVMDDLWESKTNWKQVKAGLVEAYDMINTLYRPIGQQSIPFNQVIEIRKRIHNVIYNIETKNKNSNYFKVKDGSIFEELSDIHHMAIDINTDAITRCRMRKKQRWSY